MPRSWSTIDKLPPLYMAWTDVLAHVCRQLKLDNLDLSLKGGSFAPLSIANLIANELCSTDRY
jgi:hypothetical protein